MVVLMLDMDRRLGPWRLRVWGLVLNLIGNAIALFGIVQVVEGGSPLLLVIGGGITMACVVALGLPAREPQ